MGRAVAVDASMFLYQFLIAVRNDGPQGQFTNSNGDVTSHLIGMFYRTIRMRESGIKPVYVFDGKPPEMKGDELKKRKEAREKAKQQMEEAQKADNTEVAVQMERRLTKVTKEHGEEAKRLLRLMGVPVVTATCEAEATAAELCKKGKVYAVATEDMDALTFGTPRLLRGLHHSESRKLPVREFRLPDALEELEMDMSQFIDMCILCGCDYTSSIKGIGFKKAFNNIKKHKNIETVIENLEKRYTVPENFNYTGARSMFVNADVTNVDDITLKWNNPDEEGLIEFLVNEKEFNLDRVKKGIERLKKSKSKSSQKRLDMFFSVKPKAKKKKVAKKSNKGKGKKRKNTSKPGTAKKKRKI